MSSRVVLSGLLFVLAVPALAVPRLVPHQGRLLDGADQPVNGELDITFSIYEFPSPPFEQEDRKLWTETRRVPVNAGFYSVVLGDDAANPLPGEIFDGKNRFLGIAVNEQDELVPRLRFGAAPYALRAELALDAELFGGETPESYWTKAELTKEELWSKSEQVDAATLGGEAPAAYWKKSEDVNAATLGGEAPSAYWKKSESVNAATLGGVAPSSLSCVDALSTFAPGLVVGAPTSLPGCNAGALGLLLRGPNGLLFCDGTSWNAVQNAAGTSRETALPSCAALRDAGTTVSGVYWIKPGDTPILTYCEQQLAGGGWAMVHNSVGSHDTLSFWRIPYAERLWRRGSPDLATNFYDGNLYRYGRTYMDVVEGLQGREGILFIATTTGIDEETMQFADPVYVSGPSHSSFDCHFAAGWSSFDYDGDASTGNCANSYNGVTQHYCSCWNTSLGSDADSSGTVDQRDFDWGPHVDGGIASGLGLASDNSQYTRVRRLTRFARW